MQNNVRQWVDKAGGRNQQSTEEEISFYTIEKQTNKRAIMLDIEFENGNCLALPYAYLTKIKYDLSEGITIIWGGTHIKVEGRNLKKLYTYLTRHKVMQLHESIGKVDDREEKSLFIEKIQVLNDF